MASVGVWEGRGRATLRDGAESTTGNRLGRLLRPLFFLGHESGDEVRSPGVNYRHFGPLLAGRTHFAARFWGAI